MADECGAKADVSNLLAIDGGEYVHAIQNYNKQKDGRMHGNDAYVIAMRILFGIAPARTWRDGNEAAKQFAQQSGQGATPLKLYGVIGHGAGDERICDQNGDHCYTTNDIFAVAKEKSNERNSFSNARKRIGPPKCWLTRSANVFGVACTSAATWAPEWADQIARIGVTVNGANGLLEGEYPGNRSNARVWFQESEEDTYGSATQFLASPYWVHSSGRQ